MLTTKRSGRPRKNQASENGETAIAQESEVAEAGAKGKTKKENVKVFRIPSLKLERVRVRIVGLTPYEQNRINPETLDKIIAEQEKGGSKRGRPKDRPARDINREVAACAHYIERQDGSDGLPIWDRCRFGAPVAALQKCFVTTGWNKFGISKATVNATLRVTAGEENADTGGLIPIETKIAKGKGPTVRRGQGKLNMSFHIFYHPQFWPWAIEPEIVFDANALSVEDIIAYIAHGGHSVGIGNNRPEVGGENGAFRVDRVMELGAAY